MMVYLWIKVKSKNAGPVTDPGPASINACLLKGFGLTDRNDNKTIEPDCGEGYETKAYLDLNNDRSITSTEAWSYYLSHLETCAAVTRQMEMVGFEYPFDATPAMRDYVRKITAGSRNQKEIAGRIFKAILEDLAVRSNLDVHIRENGDQTASEIFENSFGARFANCNEYTSLFIALARLAGLEAAYCYIRTNPRTGRQPYRHSCPLVVCDGQKMVVDLTIPRLDILPELSALPRKNNEDNFSVMTDLEAVACHCYNEGVVYFQQAQEEPAETTKAIKLRLAEKNLLWAIELNPKLGLAYLELARFSEYQGQLEAAEKYIDQARVCDPWNPPIIDLYEKIHGPIRR